MLREIGLELFSCMVSTVSLNTAVSVRFGIFQGYNGLCKGSCSSQALQSKVKFDFSSTILYGSVCGRWNCGVMFFTSRSFEHTGR